MKISKLLMMLAAAVLAVGCGGDDPNDVGGGNQPTVQIGRASCRERV